MKTMTGKLLSKLICQLTSVFQPKHTPGNNRSRISTKIKIIK